MARSPASGEDGDGAGEAILHAAVPAEAPSPGDGHAVEAAYAVTSAPPVEPSAWRDTLMAHQATIRTLARQAVAQKSPDAKALMQLLVRVDTALETDIGDTEGLTLFGQVRDWVNA